MPHFDCAVDVQGHLHLPALPHNRSASVRSWSLLVFNAAFPASAALASCSLPFTLPFSASTTAMSTPPFDQRKNQHPMPDVILSLPLRTSNLVSQYPDILSCVQTGLQHHHSAEDGVSDHESSDFELTDDESSDGRSSVEVRSASLSRLARIVRLEQAEVDSEESVDGGSDEDSDEDSDDEGDDAMDCVDESDYGEPMDVDP